MKTNKILEKVISLESYFRTGLKDATALRNEIETSEAVSISPSREKRLAKRQQWKAEVEAQVNRVRKNT